jgi:hypothetical protein
MRRLVWLLAVALVCVLPSRTLADSHRLSGYARYASSCGTQLHGDDAAAYRPRECTAGVAVNVSRNGMKVRPARGNPLRVRFIRTTVFESDSGEGVLDGLVGGDYVCVSYMPHSGTVTALLVVFDPETIPCASRKHLSS